LALALTKPSGISQRFLNDAALNYLFQRYPEEYANRVLGTTWWSKQVEVAEALLQYKRVFVKASHSVGKTHLAGGLVNWFFDCFDPSISITTAPTKAQVDDLLWKEVRVQRHGRAGLFPKASRMETAPDHFAQGMTAFSSDAFQGRHEERVLIVFDEAVGIDAPFWTASEGMMTNPHSCYWLAIMNPTDTASRAYLEEQAGNWHIVTISALDHPNVAAELRGEPAPFHAAVRLAWVEARIREWCTPIPSSDKKATDIEFPPQSGIWYRPGGLFESRVLGRWPSQTDVSVWSEAMWQASLVPQSVVLDAPLEIGCDVARFGDDYTSFHVRRGNCSLWHETHNGWSTVQTAGQLKQLIKQFARKPNPVLANDVGEDPRKVLVKIDDDGVGGGVTDQKEGYNFSGLSGANRAVMPNDYPNRRSEMWFSTAKRAEEGLLDISRLDAEMQRLIRQQVMAPKWNIDAQGRRVVEPKDITKKRIGRSPDDADAFNLAYATPRIFTSRGA